MSQAALIEEMMKATKLSPEERAELQKELQQTPIEAVISELSGLSAAEDVHCATINAIKDMGTPVDSEYTGALLDLEYKLRAVRTLAATKMKEIAALMREDS